MVLIIHYCQGLRGVCPYEKTTLNYIKIIGRILHMVVANMKKLDITKIAFLVFLVVVVVVLLLIDRPAKEATSFWGIKLEHFRKDVLLKKGDPQEALTVDYWRYDADVGMYYINFVNNKVTAVRYEGVIPEVNIYGLAYGDGLDEIIKTMGKIYKTAKDEKGNKLVLYPRQNIFFLMDDGLVSSLGIYDPELSEFDVE